MTVPPPAACLEELAPHAVEVLEQLKRDAAAAAAAAASGATGGTGGAAATKRQAVTDAMRAGVLSALGATAHDLLELQGYSGEEAAKAAAAEAEGRGCGPWRVSRLTLEEAKAAVVDLARTMLLLRQELPLCLMGCTEAAQVGMHALV